MVLVINVRVLAVGCLRGAEQPTPRRGVCCPPRESPPKVHSDLFESILTSFNLTSLSTCAVLRPTVFVLFSLVVLSRRALQWTGMKNNAFPDFPHFACVAMEVFRGAPRGRVQSRFSHFFATVLQNGEARVCKNACIFSAPPAPPFNVGEDQPALLCAFAGQH